MDWYLEVRLRPAPLKAIRAAADTSIEGHERARAPAADARARATTNRAAAAPARLHRHRLRVSARARRARMQVNALAELVADLLEPTGLVPADRLAAARGRAGRGSLAQALVDEGLASPEGVARARAERYHLPFVDIRAERSLPTRSSRSRWPCSSGPARCRTEIDGGAARGCDRRSRQHRRRSTSCASPRG